MLLLDQLLKVEEIKLSFTHKILCAPLPSKFQLPTITIFDGIGDPVEHVSCFKS